MRNKEFSYKYAARINSFAHDLQRGGLEQALAKIATIPGISHVDLNYPDHFSNHEPETIKLLLEQHHLRLNGVAIRYYSYPDFAAGAFSNPDVTVVEKAIRETSLAAELTLKLGGQVLTIWPGQDGFRYPFQLDYQTIWRQCIACYRRVVDSTSLPISIEYKPDEPRSFLLLNDIGTTLLALREIDRPNIGLTLDFCHSLYAKEQPAYALMLTAAQQTKILGIHFNDGYGYRDDGLIAGTANIFKGLEFLYWLDKINYQGVIYFDTFPEGCEDPAVEVGANIQLTEKMLSILKKLDLNTVDELQKRQDGVNLQLYLWEHLLEGGVNSKK